MKKKILSNNILWTAGTFTALGMVFAIAAIPKGPYETVKNLEKSAKILEKEIEMRKCVYGLLADKVIAIDQELAAEEGIEMLPPLERAKCIKIFQNLN